MTHDTEQLTFSNEKGAARSVWIASALLIAIVAWMGSGMFLPSETPDVAPAGPAIVEPVAVTVQTSTARPVTLYFQAEGQALPDRDTTFRAETSGDVAAVLVSKGQDVAEGAVIARLSTTRAEADLARAREEVNRAQEEFDNTSSLFDRGLVTESRVSQTFATLTNARAALTAAEDAIRSSEILAPFAGRIETLTLDPGEFVQTGMEVGRIVDNRPLTVSIQVPQQALGRIKNGQTATITFITGETREGTVSFVGTSANAETRTFLAEIAVPNADGAIPAGISAKVRIPTGISEAHFVQPSMVSLSPDGRLGVKAVGESQQVVFHPIEIVRAEIDGIWVVGLPKSTDLIVIGQGFVNEGEEVRATFAEDGV